MTQVDVESAESFVETTARTPPYVVEGRFRLDGNLTENLSYFRNSVLNDDWDCVFIVDGREGAGKSTIASQIAMFLDKDRNIDLDTQVAFTPQELIDKAMKLERGKALIFDESRTGLNRRRSLSEANFNITNFLAECRQRNLFIVIVLPYFHDLDIYVTLSRTFFLIHTKIILDLNERKLVRGFYDFYSVDRVKRMFCDEKYRRYRSYMKPNFSGRFTGCYAFDSVRYRAMKQEALAKYQDKKEPEDTETVDAPLEPKLEKKVEVLIHENQEVMERLGRALGVGIR